MTKSPAEKRLSVDELTRLAFLYAEDDRAAYLDAWRGVNDVNGKAVQAETRALLKQLREYRLKRWGKTKLECITENSRPVSITSLTKWHT